MCTKIHGGILLSFKKLSKLRYSSSCYVDIVRILNNNQLQNQYLNSIISTESIMTVNNISMYIVCILCNTQTNLSDVCNSVVSGVIVY